MSVTLSGQQPQPSPSIEMLKHPLRHLIESGEVEIVARSSAKGSDLEAAMKNVAVARAQLNLAAASAAAAAPSAASEIQRGWVHVITDEGFSTSVSNSAANSPRDPQPQPAGGPSQTEEEGTRAKTPAAKTPVAKAEGASGGERAQTPGAEHLADSRVLAPAAEVVKAPIAPLREPQRRIAMPPAPTAKPPAAPVEEPKTLCELFHEKVAPLKASATATLACANEKAGAAFDCASKKIEVFCNDTLGFNVVQQGAQYIFVKV